MAKLRKTRFAKTLSLIMVLSLTVCCFASCGKKGDADASTTPSTTTPALTQPPATEPADTAPADINPLTGEAGYNKELLGNRPVMISVENHPDARPQWGIASADIVWEVEVEGGISRMMLMYADASRIPAKVGPTRSARHYFIELVEGFDAIFVHFGGSPKAYDYISAYSTDHIDGMSDGSYYSKDHSRNVAIEHKSYTTGDNVMKAIENKGFRTELNDEYENPFKFNSSAVKLKDGECTKIKVPFSDGFTYNLTYNEDENVYYSALGSKPFMDDNGTQQNFTNVIVVYAGVSPLGDKKGRVTYDLSSGKGIYASNGTYQEITWKKGDVTDMLKFYDAEGNELKLNPGRSYIALIDNDNTANIN